MNNSSEKQSKALHVVVVNDKKFAVEERNGNMSFNLTQMAKPFGKQKSPGNWNRTDEVQRYLKALAVMQKCDTADLVEVRQGGTPEKQGTWANDYRIAMRFAQWLDIDFAIAVDELIYKLLTKQAVVLEPKRGVMPIYHNHKKLYQYSQVLKAFGRSPKGKAIDRKRKHPGHFVMLYGRNFITEDYFNLLEGYYNYVDGKQLSIEFNDEQHG